MLDTQNLIFPLILLFIISIILILFGVFIILFVKKTVQTMTQNMNNDYIKYKDELKAQNDTLSKQILKQLSQNIVSGNTTKNNEPNEKNLMNIFIKLSETIKENCISAMNQIGAVRIAIYLFHNGVQSTHGINFFKVSCMCEKVAIGSGIREQMMEHTNLPINVFDDMIIMLKNNGRFIIMNDEKIQETSHKLFISAEKIKYTQLVTIFDINNDLIGFVSVEMDRPFTKDDADAEKEILDELIKQLVPVLSYSDYFSAKI